MNYKRKIKKNIYSEEIGKLKDEIEYNPLISIITPYYNAEEYIEETARSVLSQTFSLFEWIIVDDGSSTESKEKLRKIEKRDKRIRVLENTVSNLGPAQARDMGIRNSAKSSKYIVFLDADDLYDNTFLECAYWTLETHPEASWTYSDSVNFGARNFLWRKWYDVDWELKENILLVSACIRKKDLLEVGCFGIKEKKIYEDWYLWIKLIKAGKFPIRMSSLLTYYRQKESSSELKSSSQSNKKYAMRIIENVKRDTVYCKEGIQFPKYDYNWQKIEDDKRKEFLENAFLQKEDTESNKIKKKNKINILMIIPWMVTGGADRFNFTMVKNMNKDLFSFTIITTLPSSNEWRRKFEKYANIYSLPDFLEMKEWTGFIKYLIEKNNINLIYISNSEFGYKILPYIKSKYPKIPICDFVHMEEWYNRNGGFSRDSSVMKSVIDKTFTCNENSRKIFIDFFNRKSEDVKTIYIGVDEKKFNPERIKKEELLKRFKYGEKFKNKIIISYVCRITEQKRPYLFFEVIKKLSEIRDDFIAIVAGDGNMLEGLKNKVKEQRLEDYFVFIRKN